MRITLLFITFLLFGTSIAPAYAQTTAMGIGVLGGEPTGITLKQWLTRDTAFDAAAGWSFQEDTAFQIHGDYLIHDFDALQFRATRPALYYGGGARIKFNEDGDNRFGLRVPIGINYFFAKYKTDFFVELAPVLDLAPDTEFRINGGFGVRWFFE